MRGPHICLISIRCQKSGRCPLVSISVIIGELHFSSRSENIGSDFSTKHRVGTVIIDRIFWWRHIHAAVLRGHPKCTLSNEAQCKGGRGTHQVPSPKKQQVQRPGQSEACDSFTYRNSVLKLFKTSVAVFIWPVGDVLKIDMCLPRRWRMAIARVVAM